MHTHTHTRPLNPTQNATAVTQVNICGYKKNPETERKRSDKIAQVRLSNEWKYFVRYQRIDIV
jgi:hypothetical protein